MNLETKSKASEQVSTGNLNEIENHSRPLTRGSFSTMGTEHSGIVASLILQPKSATHLPAML